jgi:hypothetical protein
LGEWHIAHFALNIAAGSSAADAVAPTGTFFDIDIRKTNTEKRIIAISLFLFLIIDGSSLIILDLLTFPIFGMANGMPTLAGALAFL